MMRFVLLLMIALIAAGSAFAAESGLTLEADEIDFGVIKGSDVPQKSVKITNRGAKTVTILRANSSCGCTRASIMETKLHSGESAYVNIQLDLMDYLSDKVHSAVWLDTDDEKERPRVTVRASVTPVYTVFPAVADFGRVKRNAPLVKRLRIAHQYGPSITVLNVEPTESVLTSLSRPTPAALREASDLELTVQLAPGLEPGPLHAHVAIVTDSKHMPRLEIPIRAEIVGVECTIKPKVLVFRDATPGSELGRLRVEGANALRIGSVNLGDKDIAISTIEVMPNKAYEITLQLTSSALDAKKAGKIQIEVQEGDLTEVREIAYYGTIGKS